MTQIITAISKKYVLLASDRRLTFITGPKKGEMKDDDTCKLVSLCHMSGIGYTGLAEIEGKATHEWIAAILAAERCSDPVCASRILGERARVALSGIDPTLRRQAFVLAGWYYIKGLSGLRPHWCVVSNMIDASGKSLSTVSESFGTFVHGLNDNEDIALSVIGQPLTLERGQLLERNLRKIVTREISAKEALRLLVDEVIHTSTKSNTVGRNILALCIPGAAAENHIATGKSILLATQPGDEGAPSFCYYNPTYNELKQLGPTTTCGGIAVTDVTTENDPSRQYQSASLRILALPNQREE